MNEKKGAISKLSFNFAVKVITVYKYLIRNKKECDESIYWLDLLLKTNFIDSSRYTELNSDANALLKMIRSAIITTKSTYLKKTHHP